MFLMRLRVAAEDGILWGVKIALVLVFLGTALWMIAGDYSVVRQRALNGQRAFEFLQQPPPPTAKPLEHTP